MSGPKINSGGGQPGQTRAADGNQPADVHLADSRLSFSFSTCPSPIPHRGTRAADARLRPPPPRHASRPAALDARPRVAFSRDLARPGPRRSPSAVPLPYEAGQVSGPRATRRPHTQPYRLTGPRQQRRALAMQQREGKRLPPSAGAGAQGAGPAALSPQEPQHPGRPRQQAGPAEAGRGTWWRRRGPGPASRRDSRWP